MHLGLLLVLFSLLGGVEAQENKADSFGLGSQGPLPDEFKFKKSIPAEVPDFSLWWHTEGVTDICLDDATKRDVQMRRGGNYFAGASICLPDKEETKPDVILYYAFYTEPGKQGRYAVLRYQIVFPNTNRRLEGIYSWYATEYRSQLFLNGLWVDVHMRTHYSVGSNTFFRWLLSIHQQELAMREGSR